VKKLVLILLCFSLVFGIFSLSAGAKEESVYKYYMGEVEKVKKDTGYSEPKEIGRKDPHFGWDLGEFFVSGYTSDCKDEDGSPVFLKNLCHHSTIFSLNCQEIYRYLPQNFSYFYNRYCIVYYR